MKRKICVFLAAIVALIPLGAYGDMEDQFGGYLEGLLDQVSDATESALDELARGLEQAFDWTALKAEEALAWTEEITGEIWDWASSAAQESLEWIEEKIDEIMEEIDAEIVLFEEKAPERLGYVFCKIADKAGMTAEKTEEIWRNIMDRAADEDIEPAEMARQAVEIAARSLFGAAVEGEDPTEHLERSIRQWLEETEVSE